MSNIMRKFGFNLHGKRFAKLMEVLNKQSIHESTLDSNEWLSIFAHKIVILGGSLKQDFYLGNAFPMRLYM